MSDNRKRIVHSNLLKTYFSQFQVFEQVSSVYLGIK